MCAALDLYTSLESLVAKPYYKLEQSVAVQADPRAVDRRRTPTAGRRPGRDLRPRPVGRAPQETRGRPAASIMMVSRPINQNSTRISRPSPKRTSPKLSPKENFAFHCNAYNALCIGKILDEKPAKSILDLSTKQQTVWDSRAGIIGGEVVSLNDVEHKRLRLVFAEPRVHVPRLRVGVVPRPRALRAPALSWTPSSRTGRGRGSRTRPKGSPRSATAPSRACRASSSGSRRTLLIHWRSRARERRGVRGRARGALLRAPTGR